MENLIVYSIKKSPSFSPDTLFGALSKDGGAALSEFQPFLSQVDLFFNETFYSSCTNLSDIDKKILFILRSSTSILWYETPKTAEAFIRDLKDNLLSQGSDREDRDPKDLITLTALYLANVIDKLSP